LGDIGFPGRGEKGQWGLLLPVVRNAKTIYVGNLERVNQYLGPPLHFRLPEKKVPTDPFHLFLETQYHPVKVPFASYLKEPQQVPSAKTIYFRILEHVNQYLGPPLLVLVLMGHTMDLEAVALQGAALGEGFLAQVALVRPHACTGVTVYIQVARCTVQCTVHTGSCSAAQAAVSPLPLRKRR
jgi:hypothetical protein